MSHPINNSVLSLAIRRTLTTAFLSATAVSAAYAQDAVPADQETTELDRIEVTGSRIKRADVETSQPVFSLSREDIQSQGLTSVGDVIQNITANGSTLNTTMNNGGNGETRVSLRNLGSNRTLVLVNGRRWVGGTGLGGAVDLNTIPTAAVERIEVLKDGASTIYGSDAIAGVVNVILRQNFEGAEANAYVGVFDKGDGFRQSYDFTVGSAGERWAAMLGVGYVKEDSTMAGDREISSDPVVGTGAAFGSGTSPNGRFALCPAGYDASARRCRGPQTNFNGGPGTFTYDGQGSAPRPFVPTASADGDLYNFAPENYLLTPQERKSIFASGSLDITDNVRFKVTTTFNERKSELLLAAMPVTLGTAPNTGVQGQAVFMSANNFYNRPENGGFGQDVSRINRRVTETGGRSFRQNVDTFAFNGGFEGSFDVGDKFFDWEAGYFYGENTANNTTVGLFSIPALAAALGPSFRDPADGIIKCGTPGAVIAGCVPLNILGGVGGITREMLDYVTFTAHDEFNYNQKTYYANVGGDLFEMPGNAGPFAFSFGIEHREEEGYDSPDALINSGNTTGNARTATSGGYDLDEAYLELAIPVLKDVPFAKLLDFSVATRYSDYSNFGDTLNSKFGFRWKPIEDLMLRGNWSEGFRAPSVAELFTGVGDSFPTLSDPCNTLNYAAQTPIGRQQCVAQGVPVGGYDQDNPQIRISVGGNPNLLPERSVSKTLGLVYSPSWVEGLDIALDWWNIRIEDSITALTGETIIQNCIDGTVFGNPALTNEFCPLFTRNDSGNIQTLLSANRNIGGTEVEGYDMTVGYRLPENNFGKFSFTWDTTYLAKQVFDIDGDGQFGEDNQIAPGIGQPFNANEGGDTVGEYAQNSNSWRIRSNLSVRWEKGDWGATYGARYFSHQEEPCQNFEDYGYGFLCRDTERFVGIPTDSQSNPNGVWDGEGVNGDFIDVQEAAENHIGSTTYHDVSVYFKTPWNATATIGVNNVFDKDPPIALTAFANSFDPQYEILGQFVYFRYSQKF